MAGTGSTLNGIDVKKDIQERANQMNHIRDDKQSPGAEPICGGRVKINGDINLTGKIDGPLQAMKLKDIHVTMPIASMIQT